MSFLGKQLLPAIAKIAANSKSAATSPMAKPPVFTGGVPSIVSSNPAFAHLNPTTKTPAPAPAATNGLNTVSLNPAFAHLNGSSQGILAKVVAKAGQAAANDPRVALQKASEANYADYRERGIPLENQLLESTSANTARSEIDDARLLADSTIARDRAMQSIRKYGIGMRPDEQRALERRLAFQGAAGMATAANLARRSIRDRNDAVMEDYVNLGRETQKEGMAALETSAKLRADREAANAAIRAAKRKRLLGAIGAIAGIAAAPFTGGASLAVTAGSMAGG